MSMLACARRRVQSVLPRPFAFSTTQDAQNSVDAMEVLTTMLKKQGETVSPIIPGSHNDQSV